jgi:hypothetical protein
MSAILQGLWHQIIFPKAQKKLARHTGIIDHCTPTTQKATVFEQKTDHSPPAIFDSGGGSS